MIFLDLRLLFFCRKPGDILELASILGSFRYSPRLYSALDAVNYKDFAEFMVAPIKGYDIHIPPVNGNLKGENQNFRLSETTLRYSIGMYI